METCIVEGRVGAVVAHCGPSGRCQSLSFRLLALAMARDSSAANLGRGFGCFFLRVVCSGGVSGACPGRQFLLQSDTNSWSTFEV